MLIKTLLMLGQTAVITSSVASVAQPVLNNNVVYKTKGLALTTEFTDHHEVSRDGYIKLISEGNKAFKDVDISLKLAAKFYDKNPIIAQQQIKDSNIVLSKRGPKIIISKRSLWSAISHFFNFLGGVIATAATSVAAVATFGKIKKISETLTKVSNQTLEDFNSTGDELFTFRTGRDILHLAGGVAHIAAGVGAIGEDNPDAASEEFVDATDDFNATFE